MALSRLVYDVCLCSLQVLSRTRIEVWYLLHDGNSVPDEQTSFLPDALCSRQIGFRRITFSEANQTFEASQGVRRIFNVR